MSLFTHPFVHLPVTYLPFSTLLCTRVKIWSFVEDIACHLVPCPQVVKHVLLYFCPTANLPPLVFQQSVVRVMVAEVFVGGWHMLALHVAHSSPLSTAKQIWYVMMSFLTLVSRIGYPNISICIFSIVSSISTQHWLPSRSQYGHPVQYWQWGH